MTDTTAKPKHSNQGAYHRTDQKSYQSEEWGENGADDLGADRGWAARPDRLTLARTLEAETAEHRENGPDNEAAQDNPWGGG
jgi:hypothetical protein